jgi:hypothetical protein
LFDQEEEVEAKQKSLESVFHPTANLPVTLLGLPRSGSLAIHEYFECHGRQRITAVDTKQNYEYAGFNNCHQVSLFGRCEPVETLRIEGVRVVSQPFSECGKRRQQMQMPMWWCGVSLMWRRQMHGSCRNILRSDLHMMPQRHLDLEYTRIRPRAESVYHWRNDATILYFL